MNAWQVQCFDVAIKMIAAELGKIVPKFNDKRSSVEADLESVLHGKRVHGEERYVGGLKRAIGVWEATFHSHSGRFAASEKNAKYAHNYILSLAVFFTFYKLFPSDVQEWPDLVLGRLIARF